MIFLVTGGAGFIGSALVRHLIHHTNHTVINVDKLTYAGHLSTLREVEDHPRYHFIQADICDRETMHRMVQEFRPDRVLNLAAESHVDRSIHQAQDFIQTNLVGTFQLLEVCREYWMEIKHQKDFLFHQVSTDEVFGSLGEEGQFCETTAYSPRSPYSASKAGADHLVRAWHHTYGLPALITNCSNNYGPYQFPEKLIPLMILHALEGKQLPVYGTGDNIRDWLYVEDHVEALVTVATQGRAGQTYAIGGNSERRNIHVVETICNILEDLDAPKPAGVRHFRELIHFVTDRPGHDYRYAVNTDFIHQELGWQPKESFESGLRKTISWYLNNLDWCREVQTEADL